MPPLSISIIGAGPTGLALALSLRLHVPCHLTIYEARPSPSNINGAVTLTPNALRALDALSVYNTLKLQSYQYTDLTFRNSNNVVVDTFPFGSQAAYGYPALRTYRDVLLRALLDAVNAADIAVVCNKKFAQVINETEENVTWSFEDGTTSTATLLIGADGIHSRVRAYLYPALEPAFAGMAAVTAKVPRAQLQIEESYALPVTIMHKTHGAYVIAPQMADGAEILIGKQLRLDERDRAGWHAYQKDMSALASFLREGAQDFPAVVQNAVSEIDPAGINIWPFYQVPRLDSWTSAHGRVVIMGDAAHAILPTTGQGVNQAVEDALTFAMVLARGGELGVWQDERQQRVDRISRLNDEINERRMPGWNGNEGEGFELGWLYSANFEEMVKTWLKS